MYRTMNGRGERQFSRGADDGGLEPPRRRRFRGQYFRRRSPSGGDGGGGPSAGPSGSGMYNGPRGYSGGYSGGPVGGNIQEPFQDGRADIDELKSMFSKLSTELDLVKGRVKELESIGSTSRPNQLQTGGPRDGGDDMTERDKRNKSKSLRQREKRAAKLAEKRAAHNSESTSQNDRQKTILNSDNDRPEDDNNHEDGSKPESIARSPQKPNRRTNRERNTEKRRPRREPRGKTTRPLPKENQNSINDDSTTQAAEPSSEDRAEGEDGREPGGKERVKVLRRKKPHFGRRPYGNRRRRADSSERNSNDTSPQGETNGHEDYRGKRRTNRRERVFPELTETEMNDTVQAWKRTFLSSERPVGALKKEMNAKGPKAVYEFAVSILDHAICDVTSPTKLSEIANSLYQLLVSDDNMSEVDFQKGFYGALKDISRREDDIAIDAPRYMDTLGQLLADCVIPMYGKHKNHLVRKFLNRCIEAYCPQNKAVLLASTMKAAAGIKSDRLAKEIWDTAHLSWDGLLNEGTELEEFLESHEVKFTTRTFTPEPKVRRRTPEELEKFADDVTSAVENRCSPREIDELVKEFNIEAEEAVICFGTLIYAIVRGCLVTDSGDYKLNTEALNKYSGILTAQRERQVAIALHALTALTKLWHQYNCPQDLLRTILMELHNLGAAPFESLKTWLNSADMKNIPGIGAARLNSKRYIEDLEANLKS